MTIITAVARDDARSRTGPSYARGMRVMGGIAAMIPDARVPRRHPADAIVAATRGPTTATTKAHRCDPDHSDGHGATMERRNRAHGSPGRRTCEPKKNCVMTR